MYSLAFTNLSLPSKWPFHQSLNLLQLQHVKYHRKQSLAAVSRKKVVENPSSDVIIKDEAVVKKKTTNEAVVKKKTTNEAVVKKKTTNEAVVKKKTTKTPRKTTNRTRKKAAVVDPPDDSSELVASSSNEEATAPLSIQAESAAAAIEEEKPQKAKRGRKPKNLVASSSNEEATAPLSIQAESAAAAIEEEKPQKAKRGRKPKNLVVEPEPKKLIVEPEQKKLVVELEEKASEPKPKKLIIELNEEDSEPEELTENEGSESELDLGKYEGEDISETYGWPPLVCCFGSAQHAFVPSGRPANRLVDYEIHERMKDVLWVPEKFVRAPGGSAGSVAIALASLGGKVALMGKLGRDDYGQAMLYYLNSSEVQTRSIRIDNKRQTAKSLMKVSKRGRLRMTCVRPCAEDALSKSDINIHVLKEAKMFYINTHTLLERNPRSVALQAIKIAKKFGAVVFYDVNLPLPLWNSSREEAKTLIGEVWDLADVIEVTKQELEFLCGIEGEEEFDTKNNSKSKFPHYDEDVVSPMWRENLKVLFVTNGTSKIHYYTKDFNGSVHGVEDPPLTPFSQDMSASGDAIVAALMRMLTVQLDLITDKGYLEHSIKYAINCGMTDQWIEARRRGYPPKEGQEDVVEPDENGIISLLEKEYRTLALEPVS